MPFKNREDRLAYERNRRESQRDYQREWIAKRRAEWFVGKECAVCGSIDNLELDHIDPSTKDLKLRGSHNNAIWSWSAVRREAELLKCQVLCHDCHIIKSKINKEFSSKAKLTDSDISQILILLDSGITQIVIAKQFGVVQQTISKIAVASRLSSMD